MSAYGLPICLRKPRVPRGRRLLPGREGRPPRAQGRGPPPAPSRLICPYRATMPSRCRPFARDFAAWTWHNCGYSATTRSQARNAPTSSRCSSAGLPSWRLPRAMPLETSAETPIPVRTVLRLVGDWIGRLGRVWVEGQIAELSRRGCAGYLTLRDPVAVRSVPVVCPRPVFDAAEPAPSEGARVVVLAKPDFNMTRGSLSLSALELRAVGIGELLARLERLKRSLAAEGLFARERKRRPPFLPSLIGLICGRDSAAERDVRENSARRWPSVRFQVEPVHVQGAV